MRGPILKWQNIVIEGGCSGGRVFLVDFGGVQNVVAEKPSSTIIGTYGCGEVIFCGWSRMEGFIEVRC